MFIINNDLLVPDGVLTHLSRAMQSTGFVPFPSPMPSSIRAKIPTVSDVLGRRSRTLPVHMTSPRRVPLVYRIQL